MGSRPATSSERRGQVSWEEGYIRSRPALLEQLHSDLLSRIGSGGKKRLVHSACGMADYD